MININKLNKVYNRDIIEFLKELPDKSIDMIWADPDYNVGIDYNGVKYTMTSDDYNRWYGELATECYRVLKDDGNAFFINYSKQNSYLLVNYTDKLFFEVNDYVWIYNTMMGVPKRKFTKAHRSILHCVKSDNNKFFKDEVAIPYKNLKDKRIIQRMKNGSKGAMPYSWFYFDLVKNVSKDKVDHACQLPLNMVEMFIKATTKENDICFILFGGSGKEIELCKNLNRNFLSCELHPYYYKNILNLLNLKE